jgi:hypothetical protein
MLESIEVYELDGQLRTDYDFRLHKYLADLYLSAGNYKDTLEQLNILLRYPARSSAAGLDRTLIQAQADRASSRLMARSPE